MTSWHWLPCGSDVSAFILRLRERVERTRVYVRHFSYSYVSVTCAVRIALINSSFSLFLLFFFSILILLFIHAFIDLFVLVTCMHFVLFQVPFARLMYDNLGKCYLMCLTSSVHWDWFYVLYHDSLRFKFLQQFYTWLATRQDRS